MQRPGNVWTMSPPTGSLAEQQRSLEIDQQIMEDRRENLKHPQVLLVGCGGAGRRDVFGLFKKCNIQDVRCTGCDASIGTFYAKPYFDSDTGRLKEGQPFPCMKITNMSASF